MPGEGAAGGGGAHSENALVVLITAPAGAAARSFARALVESRLAACANLVDVASVYTWAGELCEEPETLCVVKTTSARLAELEAWVLAHHPYDVPEVVALEPAHVEPRYLAWLTGALEARGPRAESPGPSGEPAP